MALVNLLELIPEARRLDEAFDCSQIANSELARGNSLYLPRRPSRRDGRGVIPYRMSGVGLGSDTSIVCESPLVAVEPHDDDDVILIIQRLVERCTIRSGTWGGRPDRPQVRGVFRSRAPLASGLFERMQVRNCGTGFELDAAISCIWRDCSFKDIGRQEPGHGLVFAPSGRQSVRSNSMANCKFESVTGVGVWFRNERATPNGGAACVANRITDCWFQNQERPGSGAIRVTDSVDVLTIDRCYFERICDGDDADILLEASLDSAPVRGVVIRGSVFARPWTTVGQKHRVRNRGFASFIAMDNDVQTRTHSSPATHAHFAGCEGQDGQARLPVWLHRNLIQWHDDTGGQAQGPTTPEDATYDGPQAVPAPEFFQEHPGSVGVRTPH